MRTWTIGAGGLIGSALVRRSSEPFITPGIPWDSPNAALGKLHEGLARFVEHVGDSPWSVTWAAGAATVTASEAAASSEAELFNAFTRLLSEAPLPQTGVVTVVSSAGAIHTGSRNPPFHESTPPAPTSPYGRARLEQENSAARHIAQRWPVVLARVSNVYGPGQDIAKLQGLISRIAVCSLTRVPLNLFVPLSTIRDYIYVDDVAEQINAWINLDLTSQPKARVRVIASGIGTSIGQVIRTAQNVGHRRVPIAMGVHPSSSYQAADLRFIPSVPYEGTPQSYTSLPVGVKAVFDDILRRIELATA